MENDRLTFDLLMAQMDQERIDKKVIEAAIDGVEPDALGLAYSIMLDEHRYKFIQPALDWVEVASFLQTYFKKCIVENYESEWADSRTTAIFDCQNWLRATWGTSEEKVRRMWRKWFDEMHLVDKEIALRLSNTVNETPRRR